MLVSRRTLRPLTLACAAMALAPGSALARPGIDPPPSKPGPEPIVIERASAPIRTGGDTTLALIVSGGALVIAAGGLGLAGRDHRRIRHLI
jgi:hypothetical protein